MNATANPAPTAIRPAMKRFARLREVLPAVGVSERTLYDMMRRGEFPRPAKIGKMSMWVEDEIEQWQLDRLKDRDEDEASELPQLS